MKIIRQINTVNSKLLLVDESIFEIMNLSDSYDSYGQQISCSDAGDSIEIITDHAVQDLQNNATAAVENVVFKGEIIRAFDDSVNYADIFDLIPISFDLAKTIDYKIYRKKVTGCTYLEDQNCKTIIIKHENGNPTHEIMKGAEYDIMIAEYNNADLLTEGFKTRILTSKNYEYKESKYQKRYFEIITIAEVETIHDFNFKTEQSRDK